MALTLEEANRVIEGAVAKARELNIRISVAVCDAGGRLVAFQRMNNAIWASAYGSQGKAIASAAFGRPSGELSERANHPTPAGIAAAEGGHMIMGQGAVPILRAGASKAPAAWAAAPHSRMRTAPRTGLGNYKRTPACRVLNTTARAFTTRSSAQGFPILTFAPAGLQSVIDVWGQPSAPINPTTEFAANLPRHRDGSAQCRRPVPRSDHRAGRMGYLHCRSHRALDHLRIDRCHLYGQCIGGSFILNLLKAQPDRIASAVLAQPIGAWALCRPAAPPGSRDGQDRSRTTRRRPSRCWRHFTKISTAAALSTAWTANSCRRSGRRVLCWPETTRRTPIPSPRSFRDCFRTASSSRSGRRDRL